MKYIILGAGGMAGHLIAIYLKEQGEDVIGIARRKLNFVPSIELDILKFSTLTKVITREKPDCIINCIGILNQFAEKNKSEAVLLNAYLPHLLADISKEIGSKVIHMSTDCVFSGEKGSYTEYDKPDGSTVYDRTKAIGELNEYNLTFRNSIVGPDINENGIGLFNWFMKQKGAICGYNKCIWTGVTTLTLAKAMHKASYSEYHGIINLVNNECITKFSLLKLFNIYSKKNLTIRSVNGVIQDKSLLRTRFDFEYNVPTYEHMIIEMFTWITSHENLYKHYLEEEI